LIALPLVRYEGLAISVPLLLLAGSRGQKRQSAVSLAVVALALVAFSLFLKIDGIGWLPSSIVAKSAAPSIGGLILNAWRNIYADFPMFVVLGFLMWRYWKIDRAWFFVIAAATVLHALFGKHGWFGRYEAYIALFAVLILVRTLLSAGRSPFPVLVMLPLAFGTLAVCTILTPMGSADTYYQQAQTARIVGLLDEPVAVNDLGLVSLRTRRYVLDLWGLGSFEALRHRLNKDDPEWISALMAHKNVRYALIYDDWFPRRPAGWIRVGRLISPAIQVTVASRVVSMYAVDAASAVTLRHALVAYTRQNGSGRALLQLD
jgi:hypothetical protein